MNMKVQRNNSKMNKVVERVNEDVPFLSVVMFLI